MQTCNLFFNPGTAPIRQLAVIFMPPLHHCPLWMGIDMRLYLPDNKFFPTLAFLQADRENKDRKISDNRIRVWDLVIFWGFRRIMRSLS